MQHPLGTTSPELGSYAVLAVATATSLFITAKRPATWRGGTSPPASLAEAGTSPLVPTLTLLILRLFLAVLVIGIGVDQVRRAAAQRQSVVSCYASDARSSSCSDSAGPRGTSGHRRPIHGCRRGLCRCPCAQAFEMGTYHFRFYTICAYTYVREAARQLG
jgi:hypothetical protein